MFVNSMSGKTLVRCSLNYFDDCDPEQEIRMGSREREAGTRSVLHDLVPLSRKELAKLPVS